MTKYFCDMCGEELKDSGHNRVKRKIGRFKIEVVTAVNGTWNAGNICHKCVLKIINEGKSIKS